ncbi:hypothetical protein MNEG_16715 [Monoraphidium neglectum]|uniref:Protein kinase domain-containing protein n=1 Tax=Monoraphidium neglectum TaxID=145388 RepID=A0A0D2LGQ9_9CHLO|nr:hypothetical protein MNEG_16715 [Monoraphidium neglectum]KIY91249.1 hypothetical protein MNEG_16715 [Monoraphidium neglectum]|eukprot:XP_013890269.1 hypothetical protein MNEG_16715 [Monoraphidium neglectum]
MSGAPPKEHPDPLKETPRYVKIADLSSGSFGFVQLARNTETNELVAIKFIERGDRQAEGQPSRGNGVRSGSGGGGGSGGGRGMHQTAAATAPRRIASSAGILRARALGKQQQQPQAGGGRRQLLGLEVNRYVEAEILNHRSLRHPHVIEFKEVFVTSEYICIAMEFASGGSLFTYVQRAVRLKEAAARWFFQQLIIGLDYCHRKGVVNRDIKLENTLLQVTGIVLVSLGPVLEGRIGVSGPHLASEVDCIAAVLAKSAVSFTK